MFNILFGKITANGSQLYAGRDFYHWTSYEELNFKYSIFLSFEARTPCLRIGDVIASVFFFVRLFVGHFGRVAVKGWHFILLLIRPLMLYAVGIAF